MGGRDGIIHQTAYINGIGLGLAFDARTERDERSGSPFAAGRSKGQRRALRLACLRSAPTRLLGRASSARRRTGGRRKRRRDADLPMTTAQFFQCKHGLLADILEKRSDCGVEPLFASNACIERLEEPRIVWCLKRRPMTRCIRACSMREAGRTG